MLTKRQEEQLSCAFSSMCNGNKVVFVVGHHYTVFECVYFLQEHFREIETKVVRVGTHARVSIKGKDGVLDIEPFHFRDQFQGREFSGVFVDEWAALDREAFNFLISRVR